MAGKFGSHLPCLQEESWTSKPPVYWAQVEASLASSAMGWGTDSPGLGWRWVVEHPSALTLAFTNQMKDGQQPVGRGEILEEAM